MVVCFCRLVERGLACSAIELVVRVLQVEGYVGVWQFLLLCLFDLQCGTDDFNLGAVHHCDAELLWGEEFANCWVDAALKSFPPYRYVDVGGVGRPCVGGLFVFWKIFDEWFRAAHSLAQAEPAGHATIQVEKSKFFERFSCLLCFGIAEEAFE